METSAQPFLDEDVMDSISCFCKSLSDTVFQQDSDPKHTCKKAKEWSKNNNIQITPCPAQSPDLNLIKHLWQHLKGRLGGHPTLPGGILELWGWVEKECKAIP